jgi:hypothetical protein
MYKSASPITVITPTAPFTWANNDKLSLSFSVPISEWAITNNLAQNDIEYASNSSTGDAADTTSFVYGQGGSAIPGALTASRNKRIRFQTPQQTGDSAVLEFDLEGSGRFVPIGSVVDSTTNLICPYQYEGTTSTYGAGLIQVNSTDWDVVFGQYAYPSGATFGAAGLAWNNAAYTGAKYRVRLVKSGQAVGFGHVGQTSSGLVKSAGQLLGTNTNDSALAGYVGEYLSTINGSNSLATGVFEDISSVSLTAGDWDVCGIVAFEATSAVTGTILRTGINSTAGNNTTGMVTGDTLTGTPTMPVFGVVINTITIPAFKVSVSATTTYYLKAGATFSAGGIDAYGRLSARRVR